MISKELEDKLIAKERNILAAQKRRDFPAVEAALAHGFHEIGGSGQLYSKSQILDRLKFVHVLDYSLERFRLLPIDATCVVLTYIATVKRRYKGEEYSNLSYRSSTWVERHMARDFSPGDAARKFNHKGSLTTKGTKESKGYGELGHLIIESSGHCFIPPNLFALHESFLNFQ